MALEARRKSPKHYDAKPLGMVRVRVLVKPTSLSPKTMNPKPEKTLNLKPKPQLTTMGYMKTQLSDDPYKP